MKGNPDKNPDKVSGFREPNPPLLAGLAGTHFATGCRDCSILPNGRIRGLLPGHSVRMEWSLMRPDQKPVPVANPLPRQSVASENPAKNPAVLAGYPDRPISTRPGNMSMASTYPPDVSLFNRIFDISQKRVPALDISLPSFSPFPSVKSVPIRVHRWLIPTSVPIRVIRVCSVTP